MAPRNPRGARRTDPTRQLAKSIERLARVVERLTEEMDRQADEQAVQLKRIGQMQAELDTIKRAWRKLPGA